MNGAALDCEQRLMCLRAYSESSDAVFPDSIIFTPRLLVSRAVFAPHPSRSLRPPPTPPRTATPPGCRFGCRFYIGMMS